MRNTDTFVPRSAPRRDTTDTSALYQLEGPRGPLGKVDGPTTVHRSE
jgi:hypothetical protein